MSRLTGSPRALAQSVVHTRARTPYHRAVPISAVEHPTRKDFILDKHTDNRGNSHRQHLRVGPGCCQHGERHCTSTVCSAKLAMFKAWHVVSACSHRAFQALCFCRRGATAADDPGSTAGCTSPAPLIGTNTLSHTLHQPTVHDAIALACLHTRSRILQKVSCSASEGFTQTSW